MKVPVQASLNIASTPSAQTSMSLCSVNIRVLRLFNQRRDGHQPQVQARRIPSAKRCHRSPLIRAVADCAFLAGDLLAELDVTVKDGAVEVSQALKEAGARFKLALLKERDLRGVRPLPAANEPWPIARGRSAAPSHWRGTMPRSSDQGPCPQRSYRYGLCLYSC